MPGVLPNLLCTGQSARRALPQVPNWGTGKAAWTEYNEKHTMADTMLAVTSRKRLKINQLMGSRGRDIMGANVKKAGMVGSSMPSPRKMEMMYGVWTVSFTFGTTQAVGLCYWLRSIFESRNVLITCQH